MHVNESGATKSGASQPITGKGTAQFRSYLPGDEVGIASILNACHPHGWGNELFWRWRHSQRSNFSPDDVTLAVVDGRLAGCFHGAILPVRLEEGLEVPMCFEGDFAVLPEYRKAGLPLQAHDLINPRLLDAGVILRGGFTSRELNDKFYHRQFGYVFAPTVTTGFRKILGLGPLQQKIARLNEHLFKSRKYLRVFRGIGLTVDLTIDQFPPSHLEISEHGMALLAGFAPSSSMKVRLPYSFLVASRRGMIPFVFALISEMLRGRIRLKGLLPHAVQLAKIFARLIWNTGKG